MRQVPREIGLATSADALTTGEATCIGAGVSKSSGGGGYGGGWVGGRIGRRYARRESVGGAAVLVVMMRCPRQTVQQDECIAPYGS
jgi:hypothetical protein